MTLELPPALYNFLPGLWEDAALPYGQRSNVNGPYALMSNASYNKEAARNTYKHKQILWLQGI